MIYLFISLLIAFHYACIYIDFFATVHGVSEVLIYGHAVFLFLVCQTKCDQCGSCRNSSCSTSYILCSLPALYDPCRNKSAVLITGIRIGIGINNYIYLLVIFFSLCSCFFTIIASDYACRNGSCRGIYPFVVIIRFNGIFASSVLESMTDP